MKKTALYVLQIAEELLQQKKFKETMNALGEIDPSSVSPDEKALYNLIRVETSLYLGDYEITEELNQATAYYKHSRDDSRFGRAKYLHGWLLISLGNHFDARELLNESYAMYKKCDDLPNQGKILNMLALLCFQLGEIDAAIEYMKKSIGIYDDLDDDLKKFVISTNLALLYFSTGRIAESIALYNDIEISVTQWSDNNTAIFYFQSAIPHGLKGDFTTAKRTIHKAVPYLADFSREQAIYFENLGWIHLLAEEYPEAEKALLEGLRLSEKIAPESALIAQIKRRLGDVCFEKGQTDRARDYADEALVVARKINERVEIAACYRLLARLEAARNNDKAAREWFKKAIDLLAMIGTGYELAVTRYLAAVADIHIEGERQALLYLAREYFKGENIEMYLDRIAAAVRRVGRPRSVPRRGVESPTIIAVNPTMKRLISLARHVAASDMAVLLSGPTGTGKDLMARYIHHQSGRAGRFVSINAAAIPDNMIEAELFGYRKGAYTGADRDKAGLVEEADQGTLYLNEIADASTKFQSKLLDVLESRRIRRLGETREREAAFRLIAATNRDLEKRIVEGEFRVDLFHRLSEVPITLPPLRERLDDIPALLEYYLRQAGIELDLDSDGKLFDTLVKALSDRVWSGNIRQFRAEVNRLALLFKGDFARMVEAVPYAPLSHRDRLLGLLNQTNWNRREVARILGISEGAVRKRIKKYNLTPDS